MEVGGKGVPPARHRPPRPAAPRPPGPACRMLTAASTIALHVLNLFARRGDEATADRSFVVPPKTFFYMRSGSTALTGLLAECEAKRKSKDENKWITDDVPACSSRHTITAALARSGSSPILMTRLKRKFLKSGKVVILNKLTALILPVLPPN